MGDDKIEILKGRPTLVIPVAAWISIVVFAWNLGASWVHFRDTVFERLHAIDVRLTEIEAHRNADESAAGERTGRIDRIEDRLDRLRSESGKGEER